MGERRVIVVEPGDYALTEHKGRFYGVGTVVVTVNAPGLPLPGEPTTIDVLRQARCCDAGHTSDADVEECWQKRLVTERTADG